MVLWCFPPGHCYLLPADVWVNWQWMILLSIDWPVNYVHDWIEPVKLCRTVIEECVFNRMLRLFNWTVTSAVHHKAVTCFLHHDCNPLRETRNIYFNSCFIRLKFLLVPFHFVYITVNVCVNIFSSIKVYMPAFNLLQCVLYDLRPPVSTFGTKPLLSDFQTSFNFSTWKFVCMHDFCVLFSFLLVTRFIFKQICGSMYWIENETLLCELAMIREKFIYNWCKQSLKITLNSNMRSES